MRTFAIIMSAVAFFVCLAASIYCAIERNTSGSIANGILSALNAALFFVNLYR